MRRLITACALLTLAAAGVIVLLAGMLQNAETSTAGSTTCVPITDMGMRDEQRREVETVYDAATAIGATPSDAVAVVAVAVLATNAAGSPEGVFADGEQDTSTAAAEITRIIQRQPGKTAADKVAAATEQSVQEVERPVALAGKWIQDTGRSTKGVSLPAGDCPVRGGSPVEAPTLDGIDCAPTSSVAERGLKPAALAVLRCTHAAHGAHVTAYYGVGQRPANSKSDHPAGRAVDIMIKDYRSATGRSAGQAIAEFHKQNAAPLKVSYIIYWDKIWSPSRASEGWRNYRHPSGATDDTSAHRDHVHVSVLREN